VRRAETRRARRQVSSAFSQLLNLHNLSEEISSAQLERAVRMGEVEQSTRSTNRSFKKLVAAGKDPAEIYRAICSQRVELVFTAHPTQARPTRALARLQ